MLYIKLFIEREKNTGQSAPECPFKLYKRQTSSCVRANFFSERVINCWNSLPHTVDFSSFSKFKRSVKRVDFTDFLRF